MTSHRGVLVFGTLGYFCGAIDDFPGTQFAGPSRGNSVRGEIIAEEELAALRKSAGG
jgi:hypothetical protein